MRSAEARHRPHKIRGVDEPFGVCIADKGDRDEATKATHLLLCHHVPWVCGQTRILDRFDLRMGSQLGGEHHRAAAHPFETQLKRLDAAMNKPRFKKTGYGSA